MYTTLPLSQVFLMLSGLILLLTNLNVLVGGMTGVIIDANATV
jgi:hypothetical protein